MDVEKMRQEIEDAAPSKLPTAAELYYYIKFHNLMTTAARNFDATKTGTDLENKIAAASLPVLAIVWNIPTDHELIHLGGIVAHRISEDAFREVINESGPTVALAGFLETVLTTYELEREKAEHGKDN